MTNKARYGLAIDIGNTRATFGLFTLASGRVTILGSISGTRFPWPSPQADSPRARQPMEIQHTLRKAIKNRRVEAAVIGSVVPGAVSPWKKALRSLVDDVLVVTHNVDIGIPISYPNPESIGADRLANAAGASLRYGSPVIVADFGTALTYDVITVKGGYTGGIIQPGLSLMFEYLAERTALLPELTRSRTVPKIGTSTEKAMQLGANLGYRGMVAETLRYLTEHYHDPKMTLIATGGDHEWVVKGFDPPVISDHTLTLFGLGVIYRRNRDLL